MGRYSSGANEVHRGGLRPLALAGKLFPTTDPDYAQPLRTANFITMEDIAGTYTAYINDAELRNAPEITVWRQPFLVIVALVFTLIDKVAGTRQIYPIAELGKPLDEPPRVRPNSCASSSHPINLGSKVKSWMYATKSWARFLTKAILFQNASSRFISK